MSMKLVGGFAGFLLAASAVGLALDQIFALSAQGANATSGAANSAFRSLPLLCALILVGVALFTLVLGLLVKFIRR